MDYSPRVVDCQIESSRGCSLWFESKMCLMNTKVRLVHVNVGCIGTSDTTRIASFWYSAKLTFLQATLGVSRKWWHILGQETMHQTQQTYGRRQGGCPLQCMCFLQDHQMSIHVRGTEDFLRPIIQWVTLLSSSLTPCPLMHFSTLKKEQLLRNHSSVQEYSARSGYNS